MVFVRDIPRGHNYVGVWAPVEVDAEAPPEVPAEAPAEASVLRTATSWNQEIFENHLYKEGEGEHFL